MRNYSNCRIAGVAILAVIPVQLSGVKATKAKKATKARGKMKINLYTYAKNIEQTLYTVDSFISTLEKSRVDVVSASLCFNNDVQVGESASKDEAG